MCVYIYVENNTNKFTPHAVYMWPSSDIIKTKNA